MATYQPLFEPEIIHVFYSTWQPDRPNNRREGLGWEWEGPYLGMPWREEASNHGMAWRGTEESYRADRDKAQGRQKP